jgi:hypothetical protein
VSERSRGGVTAVSTVRFGVLETGVLESPTTLFHWGDLSLHCSRFLVKDVCRNTCTCSTLFSLCRNTPLHESTCGCAIAYKLRNTSLRGVLETRMLRALRPLSPAREGSQSGPTGTAPTGRLFLSYHSLPSLILALAQWEGRLCDGHVVLLGSNHSDLSCGMEHSVGNFLSTAACLPSPR